MKRKGEKILILYVSFGEGHKQVRITLELEKEINATFVSNISLSLNIIKIIHPDTSSFIHTMYR